MRIFKNTILLVLISIVFILSSCRLGNKNINEKTNVNKPVFVEKTKTEKLADVVLKNKNSLDAISKLKIITASDLYKELNTNIHIIDIRSGKDFADGHIKNAVNIKMSEVIDYAQVKGLQLFDKVILICYTGQTATFSATILQMLGHDNIYVLEWGMCGWNKKFNIKWDKAISDDGIESLVTNPFPKNTPSTLPVINDHQNSGEEILYKRAKAFLKASFGKSSISYEDAEIAAKDTDNYYVICYQSEDAYNDGHLNNAVLYNPQESFKDDTDVRTLPVDKTIIIYSDKSYLSAYLTTYLNILGYDVKTLKYGANSFMNSKQILRGTGFSNSSIINYPYDTSIYIEVEGEVQSGGC